MKEKLWSAFKGAAIAAAGAAIVYVNQYITSGAVTLDPALVAVASAALNALRLTLLHYTEEPHEAQ